jgi:META domain
MKIWSLLLIFTWFLNCKNDNVIDEGGNGAKIPVELLGKWKAVSLFLSDASTGVCHGNTPTKDITIEFKSNLADDNVSYQVAGSGTVNTYFTSITFNSYNSSEKKASIKVNSIVSTKMAGSPEMMDCEQNYYTFLAESTGIEFFADSPNILHIGRLKEPNSNPRDGGTFYVFEKIK